MRDLENNENAGIPTTNLPYGSIKDTAGADFGTVIYGRVFNDPVHNIHKMMNYVGEFPDNTEDSSSTAGGNLHSYQLLDGLAKFIRTAASRKWIGRTESDGIIGAVNGQEIVMKEGVLTSSTIKLTRVINTGVYTSINTITLGNYMCIFSLQNTEALFYRRDGTLIQKIQSGNGRVSAQGTYNGKDYVVVQHISSRILRLLVYNPSLGQFVIIREDIMELRLANGLEIIKGYVYYLIDGVLYRYKIDKLEEPEVLGVYNNTDGENIITKEGIIINLSMNTNYIYITRIIDGYVTEKEFPEIISPSGIMTIHGNIYVINSSSELFRINGDLEITGKAQVQGTYLSSSNRDGFFISFTKGATQVQVYEYEVNTVFND